jgi:hypothetical protein
MVSSNPSAENVDLATKDMEATKHVEYEEGSPEQLTWTPEEEKALVRKIDLYLIPMIWLMYLLSYMDRTKSVFLPYYILSGY